MCACKHNRIVACGYLLVKSEAPELQKAKPTERDLFSERSNPKITPSKTPNSQETAHNEANHGAKTQGEAPTEAVEWLERPSFLGTSILRRRGFRSGSRGMFHAFLTRLSYRQARGLERLWARDAKDRVRDFL